MINMLYIYFAAENQKETFLSFLEEAKTMQRWITWFKDTENYNHIHTSLQNFQNFFTSAIKCLILII
jgi:hypothetical protein